MTSIIFELGRDLAKEIQAGRQAHQDIQQGKEVERREDKWGDPLAPKFVYSLVRGAEEDYGKFSGMLSRRNDPSHIKVRQYEFPIRKQRLTVQQVQNPQLGEQPYHSPFAESHAESMSPTATDPHKVEGLMRGDRASGTTTTTDLADSVFIHQPQDVAGCTSTDTGLSDLNPEAPTNAAANKVISEEGSSHRSATPSSQSDNFSLQDITQAIHQKYQPLPLDSVGIPIPRPSGLSPEHQIPAS
jgi:hypothetical protein